MLEMGSSNKADQLFSNGKTLYWILACYCYGAAYMVLYMTPWATILYSSEVGVYMFDPSSNNMVH